MYPIKHTTKMIELFDKSNQVIECFDNLNFCKKIDLRIIQIIESKYIDKVKLVMNKLQSTQLGTAKAKFELKSSDTPKPVKSMM